MRGLYINCDTTLIPASAELSKKYSKTFIFPESLGRGKVIYSADEWPEAPFHTTECHSFIIAGWFIYRAMRNNLSQLAEDIVSQGITVLDDIEIGSFVIYWHDGKKSSVIVDAMGLSSHFIDLTSDSLKVAPSVKVLHQHEKHSLNSQLVSVLNKKEHLFGDYTLYDGIERLTPGTVFSQGIKTKYSLLPSKVCTPIAELGKHVTELVNYWPYDNRLLPISSGLDSRFILAHGSFCSGFTYGPEKSPERVIAKQFENSFLDYYSYDYSEPPAYQYDQEVNDEMSYGVLKPITGLLTNYLHVKERFSNSSVFFDGYCGDVFQRGTFINFKGIQGELFKIFPWFYQLLAWDAKKILSKRYSSFSEAEFALLYGDFKDKTDDLDLDDCQKITYYEFLFSRGGRYAVFGSNILAAQFFTIASPFSHKKIFNSLVRQNFFQGIRYKTMKELWKRVPRSFTKQRVESGYKPTTNTEVIPFIQIVFRLMFHLIPSRANYSVQMKRKGKNFKNEVKDK